jgi:hypothetical protein
MLAKNLPLALRHYLPITRHPVHKLHAEVNLKIREAVFDV